MTATIAATLALLLGADPPPPPAPATGRPAGAEKAAPPAAEAWTEVVSEEAGISIRFPGKPDVSTNDVDLPAGGGKMRTWMWVSGSERARIGYLLMVMRVTGEKAEKELANASKEELARLIVQGRDDFVAKSEARIVRDEPVVLGRAVGRDMMLEGRGVRTRLLMAQQGTSLFQLMATAPDEAALEAAKPFFASFRPRS